ncbi:formate dehydrogenase accessory protein FdhE [Pseudorhodoplanes sp.]|uniref:formate dehydrogenase accessory protein FdhE n=1 Tax=Pseudorhodoplanes sp. TaxID=1934341 RepID=UPI003D0FB597
MSNGALEPDPSVIGNAVKPPFVRLPDPLRIFVDRALRLRALASGHQLEAYLRFLADLSELQYRIQDGLPEPDMPGPDIVEQGRKHKMPPLGRNRMTADAALDETFGRLLAACQTIEMPAVARAALERAAGADAGMRQTLLQAVLADAIPVESMAEHVFAAAALQVHFARLASRLEAEGLVPVGDGACPACGSPPTASLIVGWPNAEGTRFCSCSLCATLWNYLRVKCAVCGSNNGIDYQEIEGGDGHVKAETCSACHTYVKVMQQRHNPDIDPVADDVASLGLDILVRELGFNRGAVNPFLLGY